MQKYKSKFKKKRILTTENTEKKTNKNSVLSVVKKSGVERGGLCVFFVLLFKF
jgi:hypothetical protein